MTNGTDAVAVASSPDRPGRRWLSDRRRRWLLVGVLVIALSIWLGWEWLAALGALPLLLSLLPCVAMCALGLCMRSGKSDSCHAHGSTKQQQP